MHLPALPDVDNDVVDNEVFELPLLSQEFGLNVDHARRSSLDHGGSGTSDSHYVSSTNSEHTMSPSNSLRSRGANYMESSGVEFGSDEDVHLVLSFEHCFGVLL